MVCLAFAFAAASADTALETNGEVDVDKLVDGELDSILGTHEELTKQELDRENNKLETEEDDDDSEVMLDRDGK